MGIFNEYVTFTVDRMKRSLYMMKENFVCLNRILLKIPPGSVVKNATPWPPTGQEENSRY